MADIRDFKKEVEQVMAFLKFHLQEKLKTQGYGTRANSKLQRTMEYEVKPVATLMVASMYMEDYFVFVEKKTPPSRIPFGGKSTGKKVSKYIQALFRYWRNKRGLSAKKALRASFALANVQKREGRPTNDSFKHSKDGTRTGFIEQTLKAFEQRVFEILERKIGDKVEIAFTETLSDLEKIIAA